MDMDNGMRNLFHVSPRYGAVQWHDFQAAAQPVVQVSPIDHPGFVAEQVSCATPKSSRLFPHIAQDIPRLMGPEDVSPTKHEEKLLFREKQSILLDNLSKYHYLHDMEDMATTPRNEVGTPPAVRVPPKFERSRQGRLHITLGRHQQLCMLILLSTTGVSKIFLIAPQACLRILER
ncbi:hypothetical protein CIHG_05904 [Coccidioides immitis H538.4]|uniref:Uncharacterized protein n=1 Tax=Coccidioides immitis H538.4 TaxID=396776 RepID=A0A0J8RU93_COCIT|nr:hypothetical protein CIHG_05904 [Coccidioides immitis H538.4]